MGHKYSDWALLLVAMKDKSKMLSSCFTQVHQILYENSNALFSPCLLNFFIWNKMLGKLYYSFCCMLLEPSLGVLILL